jgi:hypothetical protein
VGGPSRATHGNTRPGWVGKRHPTGYLPLVVAKKCNPGLDRNNACGGWCGGQGQGRMGPPGAPPGAKGGPDGLLNGARGRTVVAGGASAPRLAHAAEAPDVTGCRGTSCSEHFLVQLAVVRVPPPPSGMGATVRHHRASSQGAELTAQHHLFLVETSWPHGPFWQEVGKAVLLRSLQPTNFIRLSARLIARLAPL